MACTLNALLLSIQTMKVYVFQTVCHGFPLVELVQGPRRKFCRLPDSMLIRLHDTGGILMPCNALKRENHTIERNNIIKSGFSEINYKTYTVL